MSQVRLFACFLAPDDSFKIPFLRIVVVHFVYYRLYILAGLAEALMQFGEKYGAVVFVCIQHHIECLFEFCRIISVELAADAEKYVTHEKEYL